MRALIAGGSGFIGSHLADALLARGDEVIAVDNFISGRPENIEHLVDHERFLFLEQDVTDPLLIEGQLDAVMDLASPASPDDFATIPL
jgi:nucleoside-diphosphate-sugar epimerase